VTVEERFSVSLRTFKLRSGRARSEALKASFFESIDYAGDQRLLGPHDGKVDGFAARERQQSVDVLGRNRDVSNFGFACRSGIAGCDEYGADQWRLGCLPGQGVLAPATADNQDFHAGLSV
jgi:hypothetical protein